MDLQEIRQQVAQATAELCEHAQLKAGALLAVGCSTSEILGEQIGACPNERVAKAVLDGLLEITRQQGIHLAAQCCEHLERALVVEREVQQRLGYEQVNVIPQPKAGGSFAAVAYQDWTEPVVVAEIRADAGMDVGGTLIGMHLKRIAVPVRLRLRRIGHAVLLCARVRPRFVGGSRAIYDDNLL